VLLVIFPSKKCLAWIAVAGMVSSALGLRDGPTFRQLFYGYWRSSTSHVEYRGLVALLFTVMVALLLISARASRSEEIHTLVGMPKDLVGRDGKSS